MFGPFQPSLLLDAALLLRTLQVLLEVVDLNAEDNVRIHLHKASVAVKGKATVTGLLSQSLHCRAVESQIQDCIHHSCHRLQAHASTACATLVSFFKISQYNTVK